MGYSIKYTAELFERSRETIRGWCSEFSTYLSPTATPMKGRTREFTDSDLEVFALIAELKGEGKTFDDVHIALASGQRGIIPQRTVSIEKGPNAEITQLQQMIVMLREETRKKELELATEQGKSALLTEQLKDANEQIQTLNERVWELQFELKRLKKE